MLLINNEWSININSCTYGMKYPLFIYSLIHSFMSKRLLIKYPLCVPGTFLGLGLEQRRKTQSLSSCCLHPRWEEKETDHK